MKNQVKHLLIALAILSTVNLRPPTAFGQGTAFTYQGQLQNNGSPANGSYNLQFTLYASNINGAAIAGPVTNRATAVSNGLFTVTIDFGASEFTGTNDWLDIAVCTNGASSFTELIPRQQLTPAPYAIFAENVVGGGLAAGTYGSAVTFNNAANQFSGTFTGNGAGITDANAAALGGLSAANFWQTSGNSGTSPTTGNFLGTVDLQPVEIRVGGLRGWRVEPDPRGDGAANLIGGYIGNVVQQPDSGGDFIGGGGYVGGVNTIYSNSSGAFIGAGSANQIGPNVNDAFIGGGFANTIGGDGFRSVIAGGEGNTVSGEGATVAGGEANTAGGLCSFAAGQDAQALYNGSFVWSDGSASTASTGINQFVARASGGFVLYSSVNNNDGLYFNNGNLGINNSSPQAPIDLHGDIIYRASAENPLWMAGITAPAGNFGFWINPNSQAIAYIDTSGNYHQVSDLRLKQDIKDLDNTLDRLLQLRPVSYRLRTAPANAPLLMGFLAQEVQPLFPELVGEQTNGVKDLVYSELVPVAIRSIQELNQKLETQAKLKDAQMAELKQKNESLEKRLENLEKRVELNTQKNGDAQ
jgi:hypothetical protein